MRCAAPAAQPALVGHVAARELGVVEQAVGGEPLEGAADGLLVVPLLQQPAAELVAAAGAVPEQAVGVGHDAFGRRLGAKLGERVVVELAALVQTPARDERRR